MRPSVWGLWEALDSIDPWGETRADLRNAIAVKANVEAQGAKRVGGGAWRVEDFMPYVERAQEQESGEDIAQRLRVAFGIPKKKAG